MLARLSFAIAVSIAMIAPETTQASAITYDFAGTLDQPINGSSQFSGSFTIGTSSNLPIPLPSWDWSEVGEDGSEVSLTVTVGGQTISYANAQDPANVTFQADVMSSGEVVPSAPPPYVWFSLLGSSAPGGGSAFELDFSHTGTNFQLADLTNLASPSYTSAAYATDPSQANGSWTDGTVTSMELVSAPEPSMLAVVGVMAVAGMAHRRFRRSS